MKIIQVSYWQVKPANLDIPQGATFPYSKEKRNELIDAITEAGYNVMLIKHVGRLVIFIDKGRFKKH